MKIKLLQQAIYKKQNHTYAAFFQEYSFYYIEISRNEKKSYDYYYDNNNKKNNMKYDDVKDDLQYTHFLLTIAIKGTEL